MRTPLLDKTMQKRETLTWPHQDQHQRFEFFYFLSMLMFRMVQHSVLLRKIGSEPSYDYERTRTSKKNGDGVER